MPSPCRFPVRTRALLCLALLAALVALPASARAAETLTVTGAVTDNYKASYNADPSARELRTWLSMDSVGAAGTAWAPAHPAAITFTSDSLAVVGADGRNGSLAMTITQGVPAADRKPTAAAFRVDPSGRWGSFLALGEPMNMEQAPHVVRWTLTVAGTAIATGAVEYRNEHAFDQLAAGALEYNGPEGRWFIGGHGIRTAAETAPPTPVVETATPPNIFTGSPGKPRLTKLLMPVRTTTRVLPVRVFGRATNNFKITYVRFAVGRGAKFGTWVRIAPRFRLRLPAGNHTWLVRAQLRDAAGGTSTIASRRVICACG